MRLTQETIRQIIKEELENVLAEEEVLEENILKKIYSFFTGDPFKGERPAFDKDATYNPGTYGAFAQGHAIIKKLKEKNVKLNRKTISTAGQAMLGSGDAKTGTVVGMGMAIAGLVPTIPALVSGVLGYAGLTAATIGLVKMFRKDPEKAKQYPTLKAFQMDEELIEIIDDRLEEKILEAYEQNFVQKLKSSPNEEMKNINVFARDWLATNKNNRTVTAPGLPPQQTP
tara:strand:- start:60 stop:743 length:684 start_codon:yes stop_codon:yes gene_type:complete